MRVKICGLMRQVDVRTALDSGADALGFVVSSPSSPRNLSLNAARKLMKSIPIFATKVAVTSANDPRSVAKICSKLKPDALQLHRYRHQLVGLIKRKHPETKLILARAISDRSSLGLASWTSRESDDGFGRFTKPQRDGRYRPNP